MNSNLQENAVPVEEAKQWTKRWRKSCPGNCSSFLIPSVDLVEVLFEMAILKGAKIDQATINNVIEAFGDSKVRAYMAIDMFNDKTTPPHMKGATMEKILMVGTKEVDGVYHDIINGQVTGTGEVLGNGKDDSGVYDFTNPCPPSCDPKSPLN